MTKHIDDLSHAEHKSALKLFFNIMKTWGVDKEAQRLLLGSPTVDAFDGWSAQQTQVQAPLPQDVLLRISYTMTIYKNLHTLFQEKTQADSWMVKPNAAFGDQTALALLITGDIEGFKTISQHLNAQLI